MRPKPTRGGLWALAAALLTVLPYVARAAIDVTGDWYLSAAGGRGELRLVQTGESLQAVGPWPVNQGMIDSTTGVFSLVLGGIIEPSGCGTVLQGVVSPDGRTLEGTAATIGPPPGCQSIDCFCSGLGPSVPLHGSRAPCGDGNLDAGEWCDDGSLAPGDCCSLACTPEPPGGACGDDGEVCTDDVCDGTGACVHLPNTASCDSVCAPGGVCGGGVCLSPEPAPAGTSCERDGNACTVDTCDGTGICVEEGARDCGPCQICRPAHGCEAWVRPNCAVAGRRAQIKLRKGATAEGDLAVFAWSDPDPGEGAASFGDPTTTTDLALCIHQPAPLTDPPAEPAGGLSIAGGDSCGGHPCWTAVRGGFLRRDPFARVTGGAPRVSLRAIDDRGTTISVWGAGIALGLPQSLDLPALLVQLVARDRPSGEDLVCWEATFANPSRRDARRFLATR